jgi:hypothetical protein
MSTKPTIPVGEAARLAHINRDGLEFAIRRGHIRIERNETGQRVVNVDDVVKLRNTLWERI